MVKVNTSKKLLPCHSSLVIIWKGDLVWFLKNRLIITIPFVTIGNLIDREAKDKMAIETELSLLLGSSGTSDTRATNKLTWRETSTPLPVGQLLHSGTENFILWSCKFIIFSTTLAWWARGSVEERRSAEINHFPSQRLFTHLKKQHKIVSTAKTIPQHKQMSRTKSRKECLWLIKKRELHVLCLLSRSRNSLVLESWIESNTISVFNK